MFSIYDILREADGDENAAGGGDTAAADAPADDNADTGSDNPNAGGDDTQDDDDFNIDASLDDDDTAAGDEGGDADSDDAGTDDMGGTDDGASGDEEEVEINTDIFDSLTAEEQQMKIRELKNQYREVYSSIDDIIDKLGNFSVDENNYYVVNRITEYIRNVRDYLGDYFTYTFPTKSYIENDIKLNEFLLIISKINSLLDKYANKIEKEEEK